MRGIQRAARFYYLQRLAFGGRVEGHTFGTATSAPARLNLLRVEEELSEAHLRLSGVTVEHLDWSACVERYDRPHTLFYLDPPYWGTEGYGVPFGLEEYGRMADLMRGMQGQAIVSVNDIPEMLADPHTTWEVGRTLNMYGTDGLVSGWDLVLKVTDEGQLLTANGDTVLETDDGLAYVVQNFRAP